MKKRFVRKDTFKLLRLGRKKKRKWRRARGRHAKVRLKRRGYPKAPSVGYGMPAKTRGLIAGLKPKLIHNVAQLKEIKADEIALVGKMGEKKKAEIAKAALESKIKILNLDPKAFLEALEKKRKKKEKKKPAEKKKPEEKKPKPAPPAPKKEKEETKEEKKEKKEKAEKEKMLRKGLRPTRVEAKAAAPRQEIKRKALEK